MGGESREEKESRGEEKEQFVVVVSVRQALRLTQTIEEKKKKTRLAQFVASFLTFPQDQEIKTYGFVCVSSLVFAQLRGLSNFNNSPCLSALVRGIFNFLRHKMEL